MINEGIILTGLFIIATLTSLITEAIKKLMGEKDYNANLIAAIVSVVVSLFIMAGYVIFNNLTINAQLIFTAISMCVLSWLCAMLGYDKVVQMLFKKDK